MSKTDFNRDKANLISSFPDVVDVKYYNHVYRCRIRPLNYQDINEYFNFIARNETYIPDTVARDGISILARDYIIALGVLSATCTPLREELKQSFGDVSMEQMAVTISQLRHLVQLFIAFSNIVAGPADEVVLQYKKEKAWRDRLKKFGVKIPSAFEVGDDAREVNVPEMEQIEDGNDGVTIDPKDLHAGITDDSHNDVSSETVDDRPAFSDTSSRTAPPRARKASTRRRASGRAPSSLMQRGKEIAKAAEAADEAAGRTIGSSDVPLI